MVAAVGGQVSFDADSYVCSGHAAWLTPWQMAGEQHAPYRARRSLSVVPVFDRVHQSRAVFSGTRGM